MMDTCTYFHLHPLFSHVRTAAVWFLPSAEGYSPPDQGRHGPVQLIVDFHCVQRWWGLLPSVLTLSLLALEVSCGLFAHHGLIQVSVK